VKTVNAVSGAHVSHVRGAESVAETNAAPRNNAVKGASAFPSAADRAASRGSAAPLINAGVAAAAHIVTPPPIRVRTIASLTSVAKAPNARRSVTENAVRPIVVARAGTCAARRALVVRSRAVGRFVADRARVAATPVSAAAGVRSAVVLTAAIRTRRPAATVNVVRKASAAAVRAAKHVLAKPSFAAEARHAQRKPHAATVPVAAVPPDRAAARAAAMRTTAAVMMRAIRATAAGLIAARQVR